MLVFNLKRKYIITPNIRHENNYNLILNRVQDQKINLGQKRIKV